MSLCVSQGAAPIGPEMVVTAAEENVVLELASKPALEKLSELNAELGPRERAMAQTGLLIGVVIDENKPEYQRGDFLIRGIIGSDQASGALAVGDRLRVGQTVRFHARDAESADEEEPVVIGWPETYVLACFVLSACPARWSPMSSSHLLLSSSSPIVLRSVQ